MQTGKLCVWWFQYRMSPTPRLEKEIPQGDICRELGLDRAYITNVENGKQNLTISTMEKVAKVLGVSVDQLLK